MAQVTLMPPSSLDIQDLDTIKGDHAATLPDRRSPPKAKSATPIPV